MSSLDYVNVLKNFFPMEICLSSRFQSPALWPGMTHFVSMLSQNERCRRGGATLSASTHFFPLMATFLVAQTINHLPTMRETRIQSLHQEDLLEKEMATHSSILAWKFPWTEEPGRL